MLIRLIAPVLTLIVFATVVSGCGERIEPLGVLSPLPQPHFVPYEVQPGPLPLPLPLERPTKSEVDSTHRWSPARGLSDRWQYIVIHHSDSHVGSLTDIDEWHRARGWENGCGYHFVIGNGTHSGDGEVEVGPRWHAQVTGAHCRLSASYARRRGVPENLYNERGIGIVLVGKLDETRPSQRQLEALTELVRYLMDACEIPESRIVSHGQVDQTECPGRYLDMGELKRRVRGFRRQASR